MNANTLKANDYRTDLKPIWCPRCGDYGFLSALYKVFEMNQQPPHETVIVSGIGCSSRLPGFVNAYGFHGLHGRILPVAMGIKLANPRLKVIGIGGDGDGLAIGMGHFIHAIRRNLDVLYVILDNNIYGLTKGQGSPTTQASHRTQSDPFGIEGDPIDPVPLALSAGAGFVARIYTGQMQNMMKILPQAFAYPGFALVHALSPCTVFHDTYEHYNSAVRMLPDDFQPTTLDRAHEYGASKEPIYTGVFYNRPRATLLQRVEKTISAHHKTSVTALDVARGWRG